MEIGNTILIDQSYFLIEDEEQPQSPQDKAEMFSEEFSKAVQDSNELQNIEDDQLIQEIVAAFLIFSLKEFSKDNSVLPSSYRLKIFIIMRIEEKEEEQAQEESQEESIDLDFEVLWEEMKDSEITEAEIVPEGEEEREEEAQEGPREFIDSEEEKPEESEESDQNSDSENENTMGENIPGNREIRSEEGATMRRDRNVSNNRFF